MTLRCIAPLILLLSLCSFVYAQQDTSFNSVITLREVMVQPDTRLSNRKEKKQGPDLQLSTDQLLESIAGVNMIRRGSYAWEPTIRGLNAGQINTTISGMAVFGACTDRMDPASSYIEPNNLQTISVNYGPGDQASGSSIGGGFNFKLKQPRLGNEKKLTGLAGIGYETNAHALQTLAALEYSSARFAIRGNGIFRRAGNYRIGGGELMPFSQYNKWNGGVSARYKLSSHQYVQADYLQDEGWNIGYPALLMDVAYARAKIGSFSYWYQPHSRSVHSWETKLYLNAIHHAMDDTRRPKEQVPMHMDMPGTSATAGFYSEIKWNSQTIHQVTTRLSGYRNRLHAEMTMFPDGGAPMYMLTIPDAQRTRIGVDISDKLAITNRLALITGIRADYDRCSIYTSSGEQQLSGMHEGELNRGDVLYNAYINGKYRLTDRWQLFGNFARAMRSATLQELYGFYLFNRTDGYDYMGNPRLAGEKSWNLSAGAEFQKEKIKIEGQTFLYLFSDYITGKPVSGYSVMTMGATGVKRYANLSSAILYGAEATLNAQLLSFLNIKSINTYTRGEDGDGHALPLIAPFKTVNTATATWRGYRLGAESVISGAQRHVSREAYGETAGEGYSIVNASLGKTFDAGARRWDINLALTNIFDSYYYEHPDILQLPRPGRSMAIHLTLEF